MRRILALTVGLLGGAGPLVSQSSQSVPAQPAPAVPPPFSEEITVTATTEEEPVGQVPVGVDVVSRAAIEERQADDAIDVLRTVAGVEIVRAGSPGKAASLFLRGTNSSHTLVLWDGVALNDPFSGGFDWSTLSTDGVERIEIVRGPFSALYGSSAVGGVVQVITRRGGPASTTARLEGGSRELLRGAVAATLPVGDPERLGLDLAGHLRQGEGAVDNDFYDGHEIALGATGALSRGARLGARLRWVGSEIGLPIDYAGAPTPRRTQRFDSRSLAVPFDWSSGTWRVEAQGGTTATDLEVEDPSDPFAASTAEARREEARLVVGRDFGEGFEVTAGGDWRRDRVDSRSAFGEGLTGERQRTWAGFAQGSLARGRLRLDAGLRRDESDAFGGETSLRAAAALRLSEHLRLRGGYGESFRAPSLADLYYPGFSNPDLEPERGESVEVALEASGGGFDGALALFTNDLDNLIEFDFATLRPENLGRARARGVEATLAYRTPGSGFFDARLAATWLDAEDLRTGRDLLRRPDVAGSLAVFVRPGEWSVGAIVRHVGERTDFGEIPLAAYSTLDLLARWRWREGLEPTLRLENAADADYEEAAGFPAPGRTWIAGVTWRAF